MSIRRQARIKALQLLYRWEMTGYEPSGRLFPDFWSMYGDRLPAAAREYAEELVCGYLEHRDSIDRWIQEVAQNWRLERMAHVDRNLLRIAAYEILYREDVPVLVSIDEAVEIARRFGSEASAAFVNGILDALARRHAKL